MLPAARRKAVLSQLARHGFATVAELCKTFDVSEMTVRRDLSELEGQGLLQRTFGGAVATEPAFFEISINAKMSQFVEEKERIGKAAAELVKHGDTVLIDAGSTTTQVAKHLGDKRVTVIAGGLSIAAELSGSHHTDLLIVGGILRKGFLSMVGPQAEAFLKDVRVDRLFLGVEGVDVDGGLTVPDVIDAHTKRAMVKCAKQTIVVADHSKLGRNTLSTIASLAEAGLLITDVGAPEEILEQIREHIEVILV